MTRVVSKIGPSSSKIGPATTETIPEGCVPDRPATSVSAARFNPRNKLPVSPMKMDAGWKLYTRKPVVAPSRDARYSADGVAPVCVNMPTMRNRPAISAVPAHRPSMLSSRLKPLVIPTIHNNVSMASPTTDPVQCSRSPKNSNADATEICTISLVDGFSDNTSSVRLKPAITRPQPSSSHS